MARQDELTRLRDRWADLDTATVRRLADALVEGRQPAASPFGTVDGRHDLRGINVSASGRLRRELSDGGGIVSEWVGIDMTGAHLAHFRWAQHAVTDCRFDDAQLEDLRCWGVRVADSSFRRANLYYAQLGAPPNVWPEPSSWTAVDFSGADLRHATARARFERVNLSGTKLTAANLGWSDLVECRFRGIVHGLILGALPVSDAPTDWQLRGVDLTNARPRRLELRGVDLGSNDVQVALPSDDAHWDIADWSHFLDRVASKIASAPDSRDRKTAEIWLDFARRNTGNRQTEGFIAEWDLQDLGGPALVDLLSSAR